MLVHIDSKPGEIAPIVIMPGDPLRGKYIAENYLSNTTQVASLRNMLAYTGYYQSKPVSIVPSGMGIPSISIYAHELYKNHKVKTIIRIGTCGTLREDISTGDLIIALGASTDSMVNRTRFEGYDFSAIADYQTFLALDLSAKRSQVSYHTGNIMSGDLLYYPAPEKMNVLNRMNILGVDMETAGLYGVMAEHGCKAAAIMTVADHISKGQSLDPMARETGLDTLIEITLGALESIHDDL
ncbi:purine-nucleoside phosphorylase [Endozoicomonas arenosclerae]|uniref:purine-nucleoside phosphorylase n=1 Tax=Endozoicomonas arenosclerae TaxID=1633495 RepID=UPI0007819D0F|nr:purine-nucleoside phosphorylase [Endozoicomonas arenosclerae]